MKFTAKSVGGLYDPYLIKSPVQMRWDYQLARFSQSASKGLKNVKETASMDWCMMMTELKLLESMQQGLIISVTFALFALICATQNLLMAFYASFTIGLIIINVLAMVPYFGWQLGSSECVGVVICVGFAVDYVVHLASHFVHSKQKDREPRMREALREMGISIMSGSATTILAVVVLFICTITVFTKFAIFVSSTIIFSIFYSLAFFAAVCHMIGPNGNVGNIGHMVNCCVNCIHVIRNTEIKIDHK